MAGAALTPRPSPATLRTGTDRQILILANPTAGRFDPGVLEKIERRLAAAGYAVRLRLTERAGEIGTTCADPTLSADVVVVAGGDGSINEAIAGFHETPAPRALAIVPFGTANVLAQELGLPTAAEAVAETILAGRTKPLHFGLANGRPFVLMASAGFDAEVVHAVPLALKRRLGKLAYVLTALRLAAQRRRGRDLLVEAADIRFTCQLAVVTNGRCYGGPFVICREANVTEPGLHVVALEKDDPWSSFRAGLALVAGRLQHSRGVRIVPVSTVRISAADPIAAQIDGDPFGSTPLEIEPGPLPVPILVP